jgi:hypothetical protein
MPSRSSDVKLEAGGHYVMLINKKNQDCSDTV